MQLLFNVNEAYVRALKEFRRSAGETEVQSIAIAKGMALVLAVIGTVLFLHSRDSQKEKSVTSKGVTAA